MPTFIEIPPALSGCNLQYCAKKIIYTGCLHTSWRVLQTNFPIFAQGKSRELEMLPGTILLMGFNPAFLCHFQQPHVSSDKIDVFLNFLNIFKLAMDNKSITKMLKIKLFKHN